MYILVISRDEPEKYWFPFEEQKKYQTLNELVQAAFELGQENPIPEDSELNAPLSKDNILAYQEGNDE